MAGGVAAMAQDPSDLNVVVVDDNQQTLALMRTILRTIGIDNPRLCDNVADALASIHRDIPDLVFTDWEMWPVSGLDFVRRLRAAAPDQLANLPIIMVTAHADRQLVEQARDAGVTEFLVKPVSVRTVVDRVNAVMKSARPFIRTPGFVGPDRRRSAQPFSGTDRRQNNATFDAKFGLERLKTAEAEIDRLKLDFEASLDAEIVKLRQAFERIAADVGASEELAVLYRRAHDLKGQGTSFGYPLVTEFAGSLCQLTKQRDRLDRQQVALVRIHVDALATVAKNHVRGDGGAIGKALRDSLARAVARVSAAD